MDSLILIMKNFILIQGKMYGYASLKAQCHPQTCATTSDKMFIRPVVAPYYKAEKINHPLGQTAPAKCSSHKPIIKSKSWSNDPKQWGPHLWYYLHTAAANYPLKPSQAQKQGMKEWLCSLRWTIPCKNCSDHYGKYIQDHRDELDMICSTRDTLFAFLHKIHNKVNKRYNKPEMSLSEAKKIYY